MRQLKAFLFFIVLFNAITAFAQPDKDKVVKLHGKKYYIHIVVKGETVYGVSKDFNLAVKDLVLENPKAMDGISPGDTLDVPFAVPVVPATAGIPQQDTLKYIYHKVLPKETLYSMTKQYGVSMAVIDSLNPELNDKGLRIGMILQIPNHHLSVSGAPPITTIVTQSSQPKPDSAKQAQAFKNLVNGLNTAIAPLPPKVQGQLLKRYNIVVMLTFSPQEADSVKMNHMMDGSQQLPLLMQIATDFYAGLKIAFDSLAMQGFDANLNVYNVPPDSASHRIDSLLTLPAIASANLIIGPPYPGLLSRVAKYALQHQIPIVSPLSGENSVLKDNPFVSKAVPSAMTEMEQTADYVALHHPKDNIIMVRNADAPDDDFYDVFWKRIRASLSIVNPGADSVVKEARYTDELDDLGHTISPIKDNVIVVPYQGASFVPKLVNQLANSKYNDEDSICIFGMHNWSNMDVLDPNNLDTLHLHYASNEYVDYKDRNVIRFIQKYRNLYYSEPMYYAFQGFDLGYYYGTMLKKYGTALQDNLINEKYKGVHTSFDFYRPLPGGGLENKAVYMLEYRNYSIVKDSLLAR